MKSLQAVITGIALSAVAIVAHAAEQTVSVPDNAALKWQDVPNTRGAVSYANVEGDIFGKGQWLHGGCRLPVVPVSGRCL